jgi:hypothetical protein
VSEFVEFCAERTDREMAKIKRSVEKRERMVKSKAVRR